MANQIRIEPQIFEAFPDVHIGVIVCQNIDNTGENGDILQVLTAEVEALPERITVDIIDHPHIAAWREAYRQFGSKPKKYPSSIENLTRRILKGYVPPHINTLVDVYNFVSIKYLLPVGGEDLDATQGDILLTIATQDELPIKLLGEDESRAPHAGEVIYKDDLGALCRRWKWKEAERTKLTASTTRAILVIEALPPVTVEQLQTALSELETLVQQATGATTNSAILNASNPNFSLIIGDIPNA